MAYSCNLPNLEIPKPLKSFILKGQAPDPNSNSNSNGMAINSYKNKPKYKEKLIIIHNFQSRGLTLLNS